MFVHIMLVGLLNNKFLSLSTESSVDLCISFSHWIVIRVCVEHTMNVGETFHLLYSQIGMFHS